MNDPYTKDHSYDESLFSNESSASADHDHHNNTTTRS